MEFLRPSGKSNEHYQFTRVRLAWYYRPSDVTERAVADSRLLLAGMYSEVCDINQIRARCYVVHRDKISDLAGWKKRPDRFYYNRLFDPYMRKELDIIQSTEVRNRKHFLRYFAPRALTIPFYAVPDNIRNTLTSRYEYVIAEKEVIPDLTDNLRLCDTCSEWCPRYGFLVWRPGSTWSNLRSSPDSVQCDHCKRYFHMQCVNPPLAAKPSRGYGWTCAPCSRRHEEEVDRFQIRNPPPNGNGNGKSTPRSNPPTTRGRGRPRKDKNQAEKEENMSIKYYKMWPFRYFG